MTVAFKSPLTSANLNAKLVSRTDDTDVTGKPNFINGLQKAGIEITAIPASGTTGQVLTKASSADFDIGWAAPIGGLIKVVHQQSGAVSTVTAVIPLDDTIPQQSEGSEFLTATITPTNASNKLKITVVLNGAHSGTAAIVCALFQDSAANALATAIGAASTGSVNMSFVHYMTAGTTSATTFKARVGSGSTFTVNGSGGNRRFGGTMATSITIEEISV
jgi:hypothetical protein